MPDNDTVKKETVVKEFEDICNESLLDVNGLNDLNYQLFCPESFFTILDKSDDDCETPLAIDSGRTSTSTIEQYEPDSVSTESLNSLLQSANENGSITSLGSTRLTSNQSVSDRSEVCVICKAMSTGKHYGVIACEGCKGFFKRTVRKKLKYHCRDVDNCEVTETSRNRCQYCRYKKCLEKGMKVEAVQKERMSSKYKRNNSNSHFDINMNLSLTDLMSAESLFNSVSVATIDNSNNYVGVTSVEMLLTTINNELYNLVAWAKVLPGFMNLKRSEQLVLIHKGWLQILICTITYRSVTDSSISEVPKIKLNETNWFAANVAEEIGWGPLFKSWHDDVIMLFKANHLKPEEVAVLKTLFLFDYESSSTIKLLRQRTLSLLSNVSKDGNITSNRLFKLTLCIPVIKNLSLSLSSSLVREISQLCKTERVPETMYSLLYELINSND